MGRFVNYYHPKMPVYLIKKLDELNYNSEEFLTWVVVFPKLPRSRFTKRTAKDNFYIFLTYYFWILYLVACVFVGVDAWAVGIFAALASPFITAGFVYFIAYFHHFRRKPLKTHVNDFLGFKQNTKK